MLTFLYVVHFTVCFILIGVVLLQRGKGQDLGASLGGGSANTIFGSRGAGNFLTKITTASAVVFMATSLSLSYLGYKSSDVRLFDEDAPFVPEGATPPAAEGTGLQEVPAAGSADAAAVEGEAPGLVEIPTESGAAAAAATGAGSTGSPATDSSAAESGGATSLDPAPAAGAPEGAAPSAEPSAVPNAEPSAAAPNAAEPTKQP